eukprot:SAG22_NODE_11970_length_461_cov_1.395028_1_plen_83_part_10
MRTATVSRWTSNSMLGGAASPGPKMLAALVLWALPSLAATVPAGSHGPAALRARHSHHTAPGPDSAADPHVLLWGPSWGTRPP